jgi:MoxR-like ATPase
MDGTTDYAIVKKAAEAGRNILLMSDAGAGKNHLAEALAADLEIPLICISLNADVQVEDLIGGLAFMGVDTGTTWFDGFFTDFMRLAQSGFRCVLVLDEVNSAQHGVVFRLHQSLDERRALSLAEKPGRETLKDGDHNLVVIGTMNPDYRGTKPLNQAFKRRFQVKLTLDYDLSVERKLLSEKGIGLYQVEKLLALAQALRKNYHDTDLSQPIGTADLLNYADNSKLFGEPIARHCLLQNYEADERPAVQEAISLHLDRARSTAANAEVPL